MNWIELEKKYILQTYKRYPVAFVRGSGKYLYDTSGKKYLDFFSGLSVCNLGHCNKYILQAIKSQAEQLVHCSNFFYIPSQILLAKQINKRAFQGKVFFSNSGTEAIECAIKIVRKYGKMISKAKQQKYEIIAFKNSFHGRTLGALSATGQKKFQQSFTPLVPGFKYAEFNNITSVNKLLTKKTCAVIIEPVQGEGGIYPAAKSFINNLRKICDKNNLLLIFDEIQCGIGRTGRFFAYENYGIMPDIICLAKSIANGLPLGVTLVRSRFANLLQYGDHGSTFGGNPVSCAAALAVMQLVTDKLLSNVRSTGGYFKKKLLWLKEKYNFIKNVRGIGLMLGMELSFPGREIVSKCLSKGLVINCTQDNVLRFLPPLNVIPKDVDVVIDILNDIFLHL